MVRAMSYHAYLKKIIKNTSNLAWQANWLLFAKMKSKEIQYGIPRTASSTIQNYELVWNAYVLPLLIYKKIKNMKKSPQWSTKMS